MEPGKSVSSHALASDNENSTDESSDDTSSDEESDKSSGERSSDESEDVDMTVTHDTQSEKNSTNDLKILEYDDVSIGQWVKVKYEGEIFLGKVLRKSCGEFLVQCLEKPSGVKDPQSLESERAAVFYDCAYENDVMPMLKKIG